MLLPLLLFIYCCHATEGGCAWDCAHCSQGRCVARYACSTGHVCPLRASPTDPCQRLQCHANGLCVAANVCVQDLPTTATPTDITTPVDRSLMVIVTLLLLGLMALVALCIGVYMTRHGLRSGR